MCAKTKGTLIDDAGCYGHGALLINTVTSRIAYRNARAPRCSDVPHGASEQYNWSNFKTHRTLWEFPASRQLYFYLFSSTSYTSIRLRVIRAGYEMVFNLTQKIALVRARTQTSVSSFGMQVAIITSFLQLKRNVALPYVDHFFYY
ncbi:hypothetical protein TNCT_405911 [Trichonephila clavata]|uniref:Uncharacterized protein n=1 Tax=Trichonephila clavata TaxID=2740835 RepID=A0A8X6LU42_TRICU|nr:hypothetical protein TNCT_405871 [Trichonephila clavata]GFR20041.1 hypothetical protein TNCT_405911 [Trichonephila clavata]